MSGEDVLEQAVIFLAAACAAVPLSKKWGLGSVLGYLLAGVVIGPFGLRLAGERGHDIMHFAEFGVVMMLFLVGLELEPARLWRLRGPVLGMGGLQVALVSLGGLGLAMALGEKWQVALAIGVVLSMSSTAIVLQSLTEKALLKTAAGQSSFAVLLFQDIAVIPILALLPLLATFPAQAGEAHSSAISSLPSWLQPIVVLGSVLAIVVLGRFGVGRVFQIIARTRLREVFTAASLLLVIGTALLMTKVGLSPALGTFVAGVVLATSEYKHELESEIEPFKGLLLGLFFIAVGASIDFALVWEHPVAILAIVFALMGIKFVVQLAVGRLFRLSWDQALLFAFALAQGGEFAFVLFSYTHQIGVLPARVTEPLVAAVAVSMALTPLAFLFVTRGVLPRFVTQTASMRPMDSVSEENPVIVAGYGRFGQVAARLLKAAGVEATLLDIDSDQVDLVRKFGARVYYGDATRVDLLESAGARHAKLLLIALDSPEKTVELVHTARRHFPNLTILARARGRTDAFELHDAGVTHIFRETLDSALQMGASALQELGMRSYQAQRASRAFRRRDEAILRETAEKRHDQSTWVAFVRQQAQNLEEVLRKDYEHALPKEVAWDLEAQKRAPRSPGGVDDTEGELD